VGILKSNCQTGSVYCKDCDYLDNARYPHVCDQFNEPLRVWYAKGQPIPIKGKLCLEACTVNPVVVKLDTKENDNVQRDDCTVKSCNNCNGSSMKFNQWPCKMCGSNRNMHIIDPDEPAVITGKELGYRVRVTGTLEDWYTMGDCIIGAVHGDIKKRFPDGSLIRTSALPNGSVLKEGDTVVTRNSSYKLGKPSL